MQTTQPDVNQMKVAKGLVLAPWMSDRKGRILEAEPVSSSLPTLIKITGAYDDAPDERFDSAIPVFSPFDLAQYQDSPIVGEIEEVIDAGDPVANPPDGTLKLWNVVVSKQKFSRIHKVTAWFHTPDGLLSATFQLGAVPSAFAKKVSKHISEFLGIQENTQKFFAEREWVKDHVSHEGTFLRKDFGPAMALACLERDLFNRPLDTGHINRLTIDIRNGRWTRGADNLCFDTRGNFINGQHRCVATILVNQGIILEVAFGHKESNIRIIDGGGKRRTVSDNYDIIQRKQEEMGVVEKGDYDIRALPPGRELKQIVNKLIYLETDTYKANTESMFNAVLETHYDALVALKPYARVLLSKIERAEKSKARLADPMVLACLVIAYTKNPERTTQAIECIVSNDGLGGQGAPLHTLADTLDHYHQSNIGKRNRPDLPLSKKVLVCLFRYIQEMSVQFTSKELDKLVHTKTKGPKARVEEALTYFKLPIAGSKQVSFIPTAEWQDEQQAEKV